MATLAKQVVTVEASVNSYENYVNPQWVALLNLLDMNVRYQRCSGAELFADDGRRILDFLSGYRVRNTGHNHPYIRGVVELAHTSAGFWSETLGLARRAVNI